MKATIASKAQKSTAQLQRPFKQVVDLSTADGFASLAMTGLGLERPYSS
jgi:hypothetical protein